MVQIKRFFLYLILLVRYRQHLLTCVRTCQVCDLFGVTYYDQPFINCEQTHQLGDQSLQKFEIGVWARFQPFQNFGEIFDRKYESLIDQYKKETQIGGQFIYSLSSKLTGQQYIVVSQIQLKNQMQFMNKVFYNFRNEKQSIQFSFSAENFEGTWILFHISVDFLQQQTTFAFYNFDLIQPIQSQIINNYPLLTEILIHRCGGLYFYQNENEQMIILQQFEGTISNAFIDYYIDEKIGIYSCDYIDFKPQCDNTILILSNFNQQFDGTLFQTQNRNEVSYTEYQIQGWVKLEQSSIEQKITTLIRVTINDDYNNDLQIGDKDFFLQYFQSSNLIENGFEISTYSYIFPIKQRYTTPDNLKITVKGEIYHNLIQKWHYIRYIIGSENENHQPLYQVYFPELKQVQQYRWPININHFISTNFYIFIGGDIYSSNYFNGQLSNLEIFFFCFEPNDFSIKCHYSCSDCFGPTETDCISCPLDSFRQYSMIAKTCDCQKSYVDINDDPICKKLNVAISQMQINEIELKCNKEGYDVCSLEEIRCSFGYFQYQKHCVQCPYYEIYQKGTSILCFDCYAYPENFIQSFTCTKEAHTFSLDPDNTFQIKQNIDSQILFYSINQYQDKQAFYLQIMNGFKGRNTCKEGYFLQNNQCFQCIQGCLECKDKASCQNCDIEYYLHPEKMCKKCPLGCLICYFSENDEKELCQKCVNGKNVYQQLCPICGDYCQDCDNNGYCNYCLQDEQSYFQSFDGINCSICNIKNCKYCISYIEINNRFITTIDVNFSLYADIMYEIKVACALCKPNYYYNQQTKECQVKAIENNCEFAIIDNYQTIQCIIGTESENAIQLNDCSQITNCIQCIKQYSDQFSFCIVCLNGYYSEIKSGQCQKCPINCKTCAEQNRIYQDSWKWEIKAFYKYLINQNNDHSFEKFALTSKQNDYEIVCLSCYQDYMLNNKQCIKNCDSGCKNCQIINNKSICVQCYDQGQIKIKSYNDEGNCVICPQNCVACLDRTDDEIKKINPYFISTSKNAYQTKICYEKQQNIQENENYYYDQNLKTVRTCFNYKKCEQQAIIKTIVHCDLQDFQNEIRQNIVSDPLFPQKNIYIANFFSSYHFNQIDSQQIWTILEKMAVTNVQFEFYFKKGFNSCKLKQINQNVNLKIQQNVFTVKQIGIKFLGFTPKTTLYVDQQIKISNFTNIIFENIILNFANNNIGYFTLFNLKPEINLKLINVEITSTSKLQNQQSYFQSEQLFSLIIFDVNIYQIEFENSFFISITSNQENQVSKVDIRNLNVFGCNFKSSNIFYFTPRSSKIDVIMENVVIQNSQFRNSSFLKSEQLSAYDFISIQMSLIKFKQINLENSSFILYIENAKELLFQSILFEQSQLINSKFYLCNIMNLKDIVIMDIDLQESNLFSNHISTLTIEKDAQQISITNCKFSKILYDQKQSFIYIVSTDENNQQQVIIEDLLVKDNKLYNKEFQEISFSHSIIQIYCNICMIKNIIIERGYGLPEITILNSSLIEISNLTIIQNKNYYSKILHSNFDCVKQFAQLNLFFFLYFGDYQNISINNLSINSTISFNSPLIIFQGKKLLEKQQNETILIQNSYFGFNQLIVYKAFYQSGVIALNSEQNSNVCLNNIIFTNNHLNEYQQDTSIISATLFVFQSRQGIFQIFSCVFIHNIITNSTNSILYVSTHQVEIRNTQFQQNNWIDYYQLIKYVLVPKIYLDGKKSLTVQQLKQIFIVKSQSGNGYLSVSHLIFDSIQVNKSFSNNAGGFYINLIGNSSFKIQQSNFYKTQASLLYSVNSLGGCLYIDAQSSSLKLVISNTVFNTVMSRKEGGGIYLIPSLLYNFIEFENITVFNSFAISCSFFSYKLTQIVQLYSQLKIINSNFQQTESGFKEFLTKLEDLQTSETLVLVYDRPLIQTMYGYIFISNCSLFSSYLTYFANLDQANSIILQQLIIQNSTVYYSSLFKLSLGLYLPGEIIINNCQILNTQVLSLKPNLTCNSKSSFQLYNLECLNQDSINDKIQISLLNTSDDDNFFNCNQNSYFAQNNQNFSLLEINNLQNFHQLRIQNLIFNNNSCDKCYYGLLKIFILSQQDNKKIILSQLKISQNICGYTGCLSIITNTDSLWIRNDLLSNRILQIQNYDKIKDNIEFQVLLQNSQFFNNKAQLGGGILVVEIQVLIMNCIFSYNSAKIGGAIYYYSSIKQLILLNSKIQYNNANIAGGLFLNDQSLQELHKLEVILDENNSTFTGSNVYETPRSLTLITNKDFILLEKKQIKFDEVQIIEQIVIQPYKALGKINKVNFLMLPSGRAIGTYEYFDQLEQKYIPYNLTLRLIALNKMNQQVKRLDRQICKITPQVINVTSQQIVKELYHALSYHNTTYNSISEDFNFDDLIIYFNPRYESDLVLRLIFSCDFINYPIQNNNPPYLITHIIQNYQLQVDVKTFDCQIGEFLNSTSGGCVLCDSFQNQYQVSQNAQNCSYKEDLKMNSIKSSMIELRPHFWRAYYYSSTIEYCQHLDVNCLGGWYPGDNSCTIGHIGALCEQCDLYNTKGDGSYSVSSTYSCGSCENISSNVISITFISLWTLISIIMSVNSTVEMIDEFIIGLKFQHFGIIIGIKTASTAILIKVITNYLQIVTTITTFQLQVPIGVITIFDSVGNPIETMAYSLDCFLVSISDIDIIYFRIIWSLLMEIIYILTFFAIDIFAVVFNIIKYNTSQITTALLYIFIFLQPNLINSLISLLSFRTISDEKWIQGNVAYRYDTYQHLKWSLAFSLPFLLLFSSILPIILWYGVYKNRLKLDKVQTRKRWGYLYNEYKLQSYYWETVKILQKEFIIIVLSYYDDHIPIKASLIFLILFGYSYFTQENKPYTTNELNLLDSQSTVVCAVSVILASSIYSAQKSNLIEIVWPFYIIIGILNFVFAAKMIIKIFFAYFYKLHQSIDKFKTFINTKFPNVASIHPFIQNLLELHSIKQARIKKRFSKLRQAIMPQIKKLLEFKKNNIELFQQKLEKSQINSRLFDIQNSERILSGLQSNKVFQIFDLVPSSPNHLPSTHYIKVYPEEIKIENQNQ